MPDSSKKHRDALQRAALDCMARGWRVLPLNGKRPLTQNGVKDATTDEGTIRAWWRRWPDANIGVALAASGLAAVDADPRNGSDAAISALLAEHGEFPPTVKALTGGGGTHWLFAADRDARLPGKLGEGVDLKHHGYVVAPPSVHPDTEASYEWDEGCSPDDLDPAPLPAWVSAGRERSSNGDLPGGDDWNVGAGERHDKLVALAGTLRHRLAVTPEEIKAMLLAMRDRFAEAPDLDDEIARVARSMGNYAPGSVPWEYRFPKATSGAARAAFETLKLGSHVVEPPCWLHEPILLRATHTLLTADPGKGKTMLSLAIVASLVQRGEVVAYLDEENGPDVMAERLRAIGADPDVLDERLHYFPYPRPREDEWGRLIEQVASLGPSLAVFDAKANFLAAADLSEDASMDATKWHAQVVQPLLAEGTAVLELDHSGHKDKTRARGSSAKSSVAEASWVLTTTSAFDPGNTTQATLTRGAKNRRGCLPVTVRLKIGGDGKGGFICEQMDDRAREDEQAYAVARAKEFLATVVHVLSEAGEQGLSQRGLFDAIRVSGLQGSDEWMRDKISGYVETPGTEVSFRQEGQTKRYYLAAKRSS